MKRYATYFSIFVLVFSAVFLLAGCVEKDTVVVIRTPYGDMRAVLYDKTPQHKENFLALAASKAYDSTLFHRVIQGFMIQGGDVNLKKGTQTEISYTIPAEIHPDLFHVKGALAAARQSDQVNPEKASSGCQFYIVQGEVYTEQKLNTDVQRLSQAAFAFFQDEKHKEESKEIAAAIQKAYLAGNYEEYTRLLIDFKPTLEERTGQNFDNAEKIPANRVKAYITEGGVPHLDDEYTVFGKVVEGLEVIDKIAAVQTGPGDKPLEDVFLSIELEEISKKEITQKYGIVYEKTK
ncbi:MAG: peptidylprolyl isomerase [Cytophagales bacterium]|nr:peptidylprolyl isomerase [Cytophagales bacterium]